MAATTSAPVVLLVGKMMERVATRLGQVATVRSLPEAEPERSAFLTKEGPGVVAAVTSSFGGFPNALFPSLPGLKLISNFGVGVDAIDVSKAHSLNIEVTNTPEVLTDDVADIALGLMLCVARQLCYSDRYVRAQRWPKEGPTRLTSKFTGKKVGILGLGRIGQAIATRAEGFECRIAYYSRSSKAGVPYEYHSTPVSLASAVDYLVVACALTPETSKIVSKEVMEALGPQGVLINIGRGGHVDEPAMVEALKSGKLGGAGLDVFADEPNVPEELLGMDNVVLLPHIGSNSVETRTEMADLVVDNVAAYLQGKPLITALPREA